MKKVTLITTKIIAFCLIISLFLTTGTTGADLPPFEPYKYMASFLTDTYTGDAIVAGQQTIQSKILDYYSNSKYKNLSGMLVDELNDNSDFVTFVEAWKLLNMKPGDLAEAKIKAEDIYKLIIFNVLDCQVNSEKYLDGQTKDTITFTTDILKEVAATGNIIEGDYLEVLTTASWSTYSQKAKDTILSMAKTRAKAWTSVSSGLSIATDIFDGAMTAKQVIEEVVKFNQLVKFSEEVTSTLQNLFVMSVSLHGTNHPMSIALNEIYTASKSEMDAYNRSIANGTETIIGKSVSYVLNFAFDTVLQSFTGSVPMLIINVGKTLSNICFSTDALIDQYMSLEAIDTFEHLVAFTTRQIRSTYKNNQTTTNAKILIETVRILFEARDLGCEYAKEYADIAFTRGLVAKISGMPNNNTYTAFVNAINSIRTSIELDYNETINFEWYKPYIEVDYPDEYFKLFDEVANPGPIENIHISETPDRYVYEFKYYVNDDNVTATIYNFNGMYADNVVIPSQIDGFTITHLDNNLFASCINLENVSIPDTVTDIGEKIFMNCINLRSIVIPETVEFIPDYAFYGCAGLKEFKMPVSTVICNSPNTFYNCKNIEKFTFSKGTGVMANYACGSINDGPCSDPSDNPYFDSYYYNYVMENTGNDFQNCNSLHGLNYDPNETYAWFFVTPWFISEAEKEIILEDGVTLISSYAFTLIKNLKNLVIPSSLKTIEMSAFCSAETIENLYIEDLAAWVNIDIAYPDHRCGDLCTCCACITNPLTVTQNFYVDNVLQEDIVIPDGIAEVKARTFFFFSSLKSVVIPDSVKTIGREAFAGCKNIRRLVLGSGLSAVGANAFKTSAYDRYGNIHDFSGIIDTYYKGDILSWLSIDFDHYATTVQDQGCGYVCSNPLSFTENFYINNKLVTDVVIPDGVTEIKQGAFCNYTKLKSVTIPDSVTSIGYSAFYGCENIKELVIPASVDMIAYNYYYWVYKASFYLCENIEKIKFTKGTGEVPKYVEDGYEYTPWYYSRNSIKEIVIEDGIQDIKPYLFIDGYTALESITIPKSVTSICDYAFDGYSHLVNVNIPESVTSIGNSAFSGCSSLTDISIPDSVTNIGDYAFYYCGYLSDVYYDGTKTQWDEISIGDYNDSLTNATIHTLTAGKFVVNSGKAHPGETINVNVSLKDNPGIVSAKLNLSYDTEKLNLISVENGEIFSDDSFKVTEDTVLYMDESATEDHTEDGVLLTLVFEVLEDAPEGDAEISLTYNESSTFNFNQKAVKFELQNGTVTIKNRFSGDANGDDELNLKDVILVRRYLAGGWGVEVDLSNSDVDGSGDVTLVDIALMTRYLAGWDVAFK